MATATATATFSKNPLKVANGPCHRDGHRPSVRVVARIDVCDRHRHRPDAPALFPCDLPRNCAVACAVAVTLGLWLRAALTDDEEDAEEYDGSNARANNRSGGRFDATRVIADGRADLLKLRLREDQVRALRVVLYTSSGVYRVCIGCSEVC